MNEYHNDFREVQSEFYWTMPQVVIGFFLTILLVGAIGFGFTVLSTPSRVITKTLETENVIMNYEWFHDANGNFDSRVSQVKQYKQLLASETDTQERSRLRVDLAAIQQSCRDLSNRYNANAAKLNRGIFRSKNLPEQLNTGDCE